MFNLIVDVFPVEKYIVCVSFVNGEIKEYDISPLFDKIEVFKKLKQDDGLFESVKVGMGGYGIVWNDEIDLSCNEIYQHGIKREK